MVIKTAWCFALLIFRPYQLRIVQWQHGRHWPEQPHPRRHEHANANRTALFNLTKHTTRCKYKYIINCYNTINYNSFLLAIWRSSLLREPCTCSLMCWIDSDSLSGSDTNCIQSCRRILNHLFANSFFFKTFDNDYLLIILYQSW